MGRLKMLVNLVILAIAAVIIWLEYQRVAEQRARAGGPWPAPAGGSGAAVANARGQDAVAEAIETVQNVAAQVATATRELTGIGPAETASEAAEREAAPAKQPEPSPGAARAPAEASGAQQPEPAGAPSAAATGAAATGAAATGAAATGAVDDPSLPANAVRGDGTSVCPEAYPIKGNASSRIFHLPGQASYERTVPEFCFASTEAAEAAGFRAPRH